MSEWTFDTNEPVLLDVKINSGRLDVEVTEHGPIEIHAPEDPSRLEVFRTGQTILVRQPPGWFSGSVRVTARVVVGSSVEVSVGSADVYVEQGCEEVSVSGASGKIRIGSARRIRVSSASGDLRLGDVAGDASVSAASADVTAGVVGGDLDVSLASGDVRVSEVHGDVAASTASGDVRIGRCDGSTIELRSISGDLDLGLPTGIRVDADLRSVTGRISVPDRDPHAPPATRNVRLSAKTTSGSIRIRRA